MLSRAEKALLAVWVLPLVIGVVAGWHTTRSPKDEGGIMLAMTGVVHVITLLTLSFYINERDTEDDPAK